MYVEEGDYARYIARAQNITLEEAAGIVPSAEAERKVIDEATSMARILVQNFAQANYGTMDFGIVIGPIAAKAEEALAARSITAEEAADIRRWLSATLYQAMNLDYTPPRAAGFAWGSANMMSQVFCRGSYILALLPSHPMAQEWAAFFARAITLHIEGQINEAGAPLECQHYNALAIGMPAMALAALDRNFGMDIPRVESRLRAVAKQRLNMLLPYDIRGGFRSGSPVGDGYYIADWTLAPLMGFFEKRDPKLAQDLAWALSESGGELGRGHPTDAAYKMVDMGTPPPVPELKSVHVPGMGFVMRNGNGALNETYLQVHAGSFSWGHGHGDKGTWIWYARGVPLMVDFAAMYTPSYRQLWLHPGGLVFDVDETVRSVEGLPVAPEDAVWRESANAQLRGLAKAPFFVTEPGRHPAAKSDFELMGAVTAFEPGKKADYARFERDITYMSRVPYALPDPHGFELFETGNGTRESYLEKPFRHTRQFLLVKDDLKNERDYLVIRDDLPGNTELAPALNLWALADAIDIKGNAFVYTGQHGVDIHGYIASPTKFDTFTRTVGHGCGFSFASYYQKTFDKPFREEQIQLRITPEKKDAPFFFILVPVKPDEKPPVFTQQKDGSVKVSFKGKTDTVGVDKNGKLILR